MSSNRCNGKALPCHCSGSEQVGMEHEAGNGNNDLDKLEYLKWSHGDDNQAPTKLRPDSTLIQTITSLKMNNSKKRLVMLSDRLQILLMFFKISGFFPGYSKRDRTSHPARAFLTTFSTIALFSIVTSTFGFTLYIATLYAAFSLWDVETVCAVITALKPLQCALNFACFFIFARRHATLIGRMDDVDTWFSRHMDIQVRPRILIGQIMIPLALMFVSTAILRLVQFTVLGEQLGVFWLTDVSLIYVPVMSVWYVVPILYFKMLNEVAQQWSRELKRKILHHRVSGSNKTVSFYFTSYSNFSFYFTSYCNFSFYFTSYCKVCNFIGSIDRFFNVFLLFTVVRCVAVIAFTLYFCTEAESVFDENRYESETHRKSVMFNIAWSSIDILITLWFIYTIASKGTTTNEQIRLVVRPVLEVRADTIDDKYHVFLFAEKVRTQPGWCISLWRAIPVERGFLFTLCSLILTYFVLILRFKPPKEVVEDLLMNNATLNTTEL